MMQIWYIDDYNILCHVPKKDILQLVISKNLCQQVLNWFYKFLQHLGQHYIYASMAAILYWPGLKIVTEKFVRNCDICQKTKVVSKKYSKLLVINVKTEKWATVAIDIVLFGDYIILSIIDMASRWVELVLILDKTSKTVTEIFNVYQ